MLVKLLKQYNIFFYLLLSGLLLLFVIFAWNTYMDSRKYNILVIHSFDESYVWMDDFEDGMKDGFRSSKVAVDVQQYFWKPAYAADETRQLAALSGWLDQFISDPPDLIIACDDRAISLLLQTKHPFSHQLPVVFTGVDYLDRDSLRHYPNVTGWTDNPDYVRCYELARQLFGWISDVTVITGDNAYADRAAIYDLVSQFSSLSNLVEVSGGADDQPDVSLMPERGTANPFRLHIEHIEQLNGSALKEVLFYRLKSICLLLKWNELYASMARLGTAPFLMTQNEGFGDGRIGGYMTTGYDQMYQAAMTAAEILKGKPVEQIPITPGIQSPVFDWHQLQYWKVDLSVLPAGSIIRNMPMYVKYEQSLLAVGIIVGLFLLLFFSLLIRLYKRESYYKRVAQKKLKREQQELNITMDALSEGVVSFTTEGTVLSVNNAAIRILGLEQQNYTGSPLCSLLDIQEEGNPSYLKQLIGSFGDHAGHSEELSDSAYVTTPRKVFPVAGNVSRLHFDDQSYGWVISFHDRTNEFTQKQFLALSMISGNLFAWQFDRTQQAFLFDKSFFDIQQLPDDGSHLIAADRFLSTIHPDDLEEVKKVMDGMLSEQITHGSITCRLRYTGQENYQWWRSFISLYPDTLASGRYNYYGVWVHIDAFKRREEELTYLRDEAEKSDRLKTVFLSNMSHEVRTPLNSIVGFSSILIDNQELAWEDRKEFIDIINENCRLLLNLINEILDISRIESGIYFREEPCDLTAIAREAVAMTEAARPDAIELRLELPDEPYILSGDSYRLVQLYAHLLSNAYKFTPHGVVTLGYRLQEKAHTVCLFVKDTGIGIAEEEKNKIFDRFYKSDEFIQGGGLGLSIVYEIVKRLHGEVLLESEVGQGSCFTICLPLPATGTGQ